MQRVVSRSELQSDSAASSDPGTDLDVTENLKYLNDLEFIQPELEPTVQQNASDGDDEVAFRLFTVSQPSKSTEGLEQAQKIRLKSPAIEDSNQGFVQAKRESSYYFQSPLSQAEKDRLASSALTGEQVVELSSSYRPGSTYAWKVLHLPASSLGRTLQGAPNSVFHNLVDDRGSQRRRRPGKKARIKVRVQLQARRKRELDGKAAADAREAADREKRTQRNREKKVKKKLREKAKKAAAGDVAESQSND